MVQTKRSMGNKNAIKAATKAAGVKDPSKMAYQSGLNKGDYLGETPQEQAERRAGNSQYDYDSVVKGAVRPYAKKSKVPVLTSGIADREMKGTIRPAFEEAKAGIEQQKALLEQKAQLDKTIADTEASGSIDNDIKRAKLQEIKDKSALIQKEMNDMGDVDTTEIAKGGDVSASETGGVYEPGLSPEEQTLDTAMTEYERATERYYQDAEKNAKLIRNIQSGAIPLSAGEKAQVDALEQSYRQLIAEQRLVNTGAAGSANVRGYQIGAAEYDPTFQGKTIGTIVSSGIAKIADLNTTMAGAVAQLEQSFKDNKISAVKDSYTILRDAAKERQDALKETVENAQQAIQDKRDAMVKAQEDVDKLVQAGAEGGAPMELLAVASQAGSVGGAIALLGDYLQKASGTAGEYLYYKRDAEANGQVPLSYNEYADMDANRKRTIVNMNSGGLSSRENQTFLTVTNKYQADPIINAAVKAGQIKTLADQIILDPNSATNQLASLYIFVKNLDPDSAVREGELSLANQTQSYLQTFNNTLARASEGRVVSPEAAVQLAEATKRLVGTWESTAEKKTKMYQSQASNSSPNVGNAFSSYINDFKEMPTPEQLEANAQSNIISYGMQNPQAQETIKELAGVVQPELGRAYTWEEIKQILGI